MRRNAISYLVPCGLLAALACQGGAPKSQEQTAGQTQGSTPLGSKQVGTKQAALDAVQRIELNRIAAELNLPLFWITDAENPGMLDRQELAVLFGLPWPEGWQPWFEKEAFSPKFLAAYEAIKKIKESGHNLSGLDEKEATRRRLMIEELSQGRQTLVSHDFRSSSAEEKELLGHLLQAIEGVEALFLRQAGANQYLAELPEDAASRMVFFRNQGPWCVAPSTESNPDCNALPSRPAKSSGLYPQEIQKDDPKFCEKLEKDPIKSKVLLDHFAAGVLKNGQLEAVPYHQFFKEEVTAISESLRRAAEAIKSESEAPFKAYLQAASAAFLDDNWVPADEAWAKMNVHNSKWYLRIGPDEVYFEPCSQKAGYHASFGLIDQGSLKWQKMLDPVKNDLEKALAERAGAPYMARTVSFHLPDFVDIVLNAGDSRSPHGATIGQSLPNWGPVANEGRGRTVAMTGFYSDPDSISAQVEQVKSLLCNSSMAAYVTDPEPQIMSTVLHEAAHNLGPSHEYKVKGKTDDQAFGGPLASTMEELKAQTSALFFTDWLANQNLISKTQAEQAHTRDLIWAFGHISRGMYTADNKPKPYSQLAAIQLRYLIKEQAIVWNAEELAANATDKGCFHFQLDKFPAAIHKLTGDVAGIKARADRKRAEALREEFVDRDDLGKKLLGVIQERLLRAPKASFVYSIRL